MASDLEDYYFTQAHRKASEAYLAAQTGSDSDKEWILKQLACADEYGRAAFLLAKNTRQRVGEYNFLCSVAGLRIIVELGYESAVMHRANPEPETIEHLRHPDAD